MPANTAPRASTPASSPCWGAATRATLLRHMQAQEQQHLDTFNALIAERRVRPTALLPFWHVAGFALGRGDRHAGRARGDGLHGGGGGGDRRALPGQAAALGDDEAALRDTIEKFRAEELEHRDIGLAHEAEQAPGLPAADAAPSRPGARWRSGERGSLTLLCGIDHPQHHRMGRGVSSGGAAGDRSRIKGSKNLARPNRHAAARLDRTREQAVAGRLFGAVR